MNLVVPSIWLVGVTILLSLLVPSHALFDAPNLLDEVHNWMADIRSLESSKGLHHRDLGNHRKSTRSLQQRTRECGQAIGKVTIDQVKELADVIIDVLVPPESVSSVLVDAFKSSITNVMKYDFMAIKVCLSCANVTTEMVDAFDNAEEYGFASYCGSDSYAREAVGLFSRWSTIVATKHATSLIRRKCVFSNEYIAPQCPRICSHEPGDRYPCSRGVSRICFCSLDESGLDIECDGILAARFGFHIGGRAAIRRSFYWGLSVYL